MLTTEEADRDLEADLELIESATPPPWEYHAPFPTKHCVIASGVGMILDAATFKPSMRDVANLKMAAAAREGWPHAIRLALERGRLLAEKDAEIARLRALLEPFAAAADRHDEIGQMVSVSEVCHCRAARDELRKGK